MDPIGHREATRQWFTEATSCRRPVRPLDVWGIQPSDDGKVCMLSGFQGNRPIFKAAGPSVPFISLLYFSFGFDAFVAAQVEINRTESRMANFAEYVKAGATSFLGKRAKNVDLNCLKVEVGEGEASRQYFPPTDGSGVASDFSTVGFMNINSLAGGLIHAEEPADFSDGKVDIFKAKDVLTTAVVHQLKHNTERHLRAVFSVDNAVAAGVFAQYDGETRFLFQPAGQTARVHVRQVMQLPAVLGPEAAAAEDDPSRADFLFVGGSEDIDEFRDRLRAWIKGDLVHEINASEDEIAALQARISREGEESDERALKRPRVE